MKTVLPSYRSAFTLIELLIVVAIIAILAAIAVPNFLEAQTRAKSTRTMADLRTLGVAMEMYRLDHNAFPPDYDSGAFGGSFPSEYRTYACLTTPIAYLSSVPLDPYQEKMNSALYRNKTVPYFEYNGNQGNPGGWAQAGIQWFMSSAGPDLRDQGLWHVNPMTSDFITAQYDPTNGTKSAGDMGRSNVKGYPD